ncbi:hypothetical protein AB0F91_26320 [Amycolatopsis sp. NPDC023774]|uniref:hypothetical protein n=1 Tax=Amycolatopsis sp. NPDC023774 TaxID=3155015 RepID=UPI0033EABC0E
MTTTAPEAIRTIVEAAWTHQLAVPAWDLTVTAADLYPMTLPGRLTARGPDDGGGLASSRPARGRHA